MTDTTSDPGSVPTVGVSLQRPTNPRRLRGALRRREGLRFTG
ncbi:MAG: hypothetical protein ACK51J_08530 [Burkholderiales bacterium]